MNPNQELIHTFYQAFQNKDFETMNACYSEEVLFSDPVFPDLNHEQVCAMWEMLIKRGKDLELTFDNIQANEHSGSADWIATYSFGTKKNKVVNHIHATFEFSDGKILRHLDEFSFPRWAGQALGLMGRLMGRTKFMKTRVQRTAQLGLEHFMELKQNAKS